VVIQRIQARNKVAYLFVRGDFSDLSLGVCLVIKEMGRRVGNLIGRL